MVTDTNIQMQGHFVYLKHPLIYEDSRQRTFSRCTVVYEGLATFAFQLKTIFGHLKTSDVNEY